MGHGSSSKYVVVRRSPVSNVIDWCVRAPAHKAEYPSPAGPVRIPHIHKVHQRAISGVLSFPPSVCPSCRYPNALASDAVVSLPTMVRMLNDRGDATSIQQLAMEALMINVDPLVATTDQTSLKQALAYVIANATVQGWSLSDNSGANDSLDVRFESGVVVVGPQ